MVTVDQVGLLALLDQQYGFLLSRSDRDRLLFLPRFLSFLCREPRLDWLVRDLVREANAICRSFLQEDERIRCTLRQKWVDHRDELRRHVDEATVLDITLDDYDRLVAEPASLPPIGDDPWRVSENQGARVFRNLSMYVDHALSAVPAADQAGWHHLNAEVMRLEREQEYEFRCLCAASRTHGGFAHMRLERIAQRVAPRPVAAEAFEDDPTAFLLGQLFRRDDRVSRLLHDPRIGDRDAEFLIAKSIGDIASDAAVLHDELRSRIAVGASRLAVVQRYAARCESFDAPRLRALCSEGPGKPEAALTLDLARYLFDHGFNPVIDPTIGGLRPDIFEAVRPSAFYVEAKQYEKAPRQMLTSAARQVWSTWSRVAHAHPVSEAFLVIFRRSGPLAQLPAAVHHEGRALNIVLVDLSASAGSREREPVVVIQSDDLMPRGDGAR